MRIFIIVMFFFFVGLILGDIDIIAGFQVNPLELYCTDAGVNSTICNDNSTIYVNTSIVCTTNNGLCTGSGSNYWVDAGNYIYPNNTYADNVVIPNGTLNVSNQGVSANFDCGVLGANDDCFKITGFGGAYEVCSVHFDGSIHCGSPSGELANTAYANTFSGSNTFSQQITSDSGIKMRYSGTEQATPLGTYAVLYMYNDTNGQQLRLRYNNGTIINVINTTSITSGFIQHNHSFITLDNGSANGGRVTIKRLNQAANPSVYAPAVNSSTVEFWGGNISTDLNTFDFGYAYYDASNFYGWDTDGAGTLFNQTALYLSVYRGASDYMGSYEWRLPVPFSGGSSGIGFEDQGAVLRWINSTNGTKLSITQGQLNYIDSNNPMRYDSDLGHFLTARTRGVTVFKFNDFFNVFYGLTDASNYLELGADFYPRVVIGNYSLGTSSAYWKNLFVNNIFTKNITTTNITSTNTITNNLTVNNNATINRIKTNSFWINSTPTNQTVTGTTLQNITNLSWTATENTNYTFNCNLYYSSNTTTNGISIALQPYGGTPTRIMYAATITGISATTVNTGYTPIAGTKISSTDVTTVNTPRQIFFTGTIINGATPLIISPQFSAEVANQNTTIIRDSTCKIEAIGG